jgi:hypothetical protein
MAPPFNAVTDNLLRWVADQIATQDLVLVLCRQVLTAKTITLIDASSDTFTSAAHGYVAGDKVVISPNGGAGVVPSPLKANSPYYVGGTVTTNTFQLAAYAGGPAIDITNIGSGALYAKKLDWGRDVTIAEVVATEVPNTNNYSRKTVLIGSANRVDIAQGYDVPEPTIITAIGGSIIFDSYAFILGGSTTYGSTSGAAVHSFGIEDTEVTVTTSVPRAFPVKTIYTNNDYATRVAE